MDEAVVRNPRLDVRRGDVAAAVSKSTAWPTSVILVCGAHRRDDEESTDLRVPTDPRRAGDGMAAARHDDLVRQVLTEGDGVCIVLIGEIDAASAPPLQRRLDEVIGSATGAVALDMSGISFIDSTGIRVLITLHRFLSTQRRSFALRAVSAQTRKVLDLAGLTSMLGVDGA
jgi:anti-sigma B factor antagonist